MQPSLIATDQPYGRSVPAGCWRLSVLGGEGVPCRLPWPAGLAAAWDQPSPLTWSSSRTQGAPYTPGAAETRREDGVRSRAAWRWWDYGYVWSSAWVDVDVRACIWVDVPAVVRRLYRRAHGSGAPLNLAAWAANVGRRPAGFVLVVGRPASRLPLPSLVLRAQVAVLGGATHSVGRQPSRLPPYALAPWLGLAAARRHRRPLRPSGTLHVNGCCAEWCGCVLLGLGLLLPVDAVDLHAAWCSSSSYSCAHRCA